jgi:hypothetical protein
MRGIMNFDDYNYCQYNDYILVSDPAANKRKSKDILAVKAITEPDKAFTESNLARLQ